MNETTLDGFFTHNQFLRLEAAYGKKWDVALALLDIEGRSVYGRVPACRPGSDVKGLLRMQIAEAVRWGEPPFVLLPNGDMAWVAPVLLNMRILGGIAAFMDPSRVDEVSDEDEDFSGRVRAAAEDLVTWLEQENLTNSSLLELHRNQTLFERRKAEAIHDSKLFTADFRLLYIREEPTLMNAIRRGEREEARGILNRILIVLLYQAGENLDLVKSFILEIITMMSRTAVEAGCDVCDVFGNKYEDFTRLSKINSDDEFSPWLHEIMERLIDAIHKSRNKSAVPQMQAALDFMKRNIGGELTRDEVASTVHMSPSHFSRFFKKMFRESFSDRLNRMRVEYATELLTHTNLSLSAVALDCGFKDQSYFTKVFRKYLDKTPSRYRAKMSSARIRRTKGDGE